MKSLLHFFTQMGNYTAPAVLLLLEAAAALILLAGFLKLRKKRRARVQLAGGERLFEQAIAQNDCGAYLLMRREDALPLYATDAFSVLLAVSFDSFRNDIERTDQYIDAGKLRRIKDDYRLWDGSQPFAASFFYAQTSRWLAVTVTRTEDGAYDLFSFRDFTEEKQKLQELEDRLKETELESRSKTAFLSKMSHEIRTPMNGMIGLLSLIKMNIQDDPQSLQYMEKVESLSQFLLSLINDILDMSRIEAGKVELAQECIDLFAMAEKLRTMFQKTVEEKHVRFVVETLDFDARYVLGDELRITQVLINFISNAVKFTSEGEIRVTFRQMQLTDGKMHLMIRVRDTGKGIAPEFLQRIFQPFEQENAGIAQQYGGSGLGMAIADQLVHLMEGEIVVDSRLGEGSDFTVYLRLPVAKAQEDEDASFKQGAYSEPAQSPLPMTDAAGEQTEYTLEGMRILMAEDNEINAQIAVAILETMGASVEVAADGNAVVQMFTEKGRGYYDVILMDIQMPLRNGWEAAKLIRGMRVIGGDRIRIYALSADAFVEDKRHSVEVGMNGHFSKPIDFEEVKRTIGYRKENKAASVREGGGA